MAWCGRGKWYYQKAGDVQQEATAMNGVIASINKEKGYMFIKGENGVEYFAHRSALKNIQFAELERGREVTFEETEGQKGPRAEDIFV
jgi:CspA family cold shock protein